VVIHCRSGVRSARAVRTLEAAGYTNLYSLRGGILAWQAEVQPELARY
jgi:rhodanese-related sulfurtransferase